MKPGVIWTPENPSQDAFLPRYIGYAANGTNRSVGAPQTKYMMKKTATSLQWSHEFQSCQHTIPSAMNGSAVMVPVAIRSAVSFLTGWMSSAVGPTGGAGAACVVVTVQDSTQKPGGRLHRCYCPRGG